MPKLTITEGCGPSPVLLKRLESGEMFVWEQEHINSCMDNIWMASDERSDADNEDRLCMCLNSGVIDRFGDNQEVYLVSASLHLG